MREVTLTVNSTTTTSAPCPMDRYVNPFSVGLGLEVTGTGNWTVQHSFDPPFGASYNPATAVWFPHASLASVTANGDGNYAFGVRAIRLLQNSGSGSAKLQIVQSGAI